MFRKIQNHFRKHLILYVAAGPLLAGITTMFSFALLSVNGMEGPAALSTVVLVGTVFGWFLFYPAALTLWNVWQLFCRRYQEEALATARITRCGYDSLGRSLRRLLSGGFRRPYGGLDRDAGQQSGSYSYCHVDGSDDLHHWNSGISGLSDSAFCSD